MRLYFLRHGDAEYTSSSDSARALTNDGLAQARHVARALETLDVRLTAILSSPFVRAQQTARSIAEAIPEISVQLTDRLKPNADPAGLFEELNHLSRDSRILLTAHEPFISTCVGELISTGQVPSISVKKASLVAVEAGAPVQRGSGILLWLMTNDQLSHLHP